ncbi:MAG: DUF695 domain-containing protein, partial [Candidatus Methanoplasma sp.]|nr:DUF695 domain-containing protein [Candidatus Methanoplasma sp.]
MVKDTAHAEDWDFYFSNVDDIISSFFIDLGLKKAAPRADRPYAAWVAVFMRNPMENGLSSKDECGTLYDIEDRVVGDVMRNHNAVFAGRLTSNGYRQLFFYLDDTSGY